MDHDRGGDREPMFNLAWPVLALIIVLGAAYVGQLSLETATIARLGLSRLGLSAGLWFEPVTHIFVHGGIGHLLMNAAAVAAFGAPVLRLLGMRNGDIALFYIFFLTCGVLAGAGYLAVNWNEPVVLIGASGAISGLWAAASRLMGRRGGIAPLLDRNVMIQAVTFAVINVAIGFLDVFAGLFIGWQAHLFGYAAGLLLIGPFARLAGRLR